MSYKKCKQCGRELPIQMYRPLYNKYGTYNVCLDCESVNSRYKYLVKKEANGTIGSEEKTELSKIEQMYQNLKLAGLKPPKQRKSVLDKVQAIQEAFDTEALKWLTAELTERPEYYIDEVFETLKGASKELKDKVLDRFYEYEDQYYGGDVNVEERHAKGSD